MPNKFQTIFLTAILFLSIFFSGLQLMPKVARAQLSGCSSGAAPLYGGYCPESITASNPSPNQVDASVTINGSMISAFTFALCNYNMGGMPGLGGYHNNVYPIVDPIIGVGGQSEVVSGSVTSSNYSPGGPSPVQTCTSSGINGSPPAFYIYGFNYTLNTSQYPNGTYSSTVYLGNSAYSTCSQNPAATVYQQSDPNNSQTWNQTPCNYLMSIVSFTVQHPQPTAGTIKVRADIATSWNVNGCSSCSGTNTTTGDYANEPANNTYKILDQNNLTLDHDGFTVDNLGSVPALRNPSSILARIINTAEASQDCSSDGWTCTLISNGTAQWNLHPQYCSMTVKTQVNGVDQPLSGLNYNVSDGVPGTTPQSYTSTPQTVQMLTDPTSPGSTFTLSDNPTVMNWNSYTLDFSGYSTGNAVSCSGGTGTIIENYLTRGKLLVQ